MNAYDLLYFPIGNPKDRSSIMRKSSMRWTPSKAAFTTAISNLRKDADALGGEGWRRLSVVGHTMETDEFYVQPTDKTPLELAG